MEQAAIEQKVADQLRVALEPYIGQYEVPLTPIMDVVKKHLPEPEYDIKITNDPVEKNKIWIDVTIPFPVEDLQVYWADKDSEATVVVPQRSFEDIYIELLKSSNNIELIKKLGLVAKLLGV